MDPSAPSRISPHTLGLCSHHLPFTPHFTACMHMEHNGVDTVVPGALRVAGPCNAIPDAETDSELEHQAQPPFSITTVQGKGNGVVATRPLPKGAVFLTERPLFTQNAARTNSGILCALSVCTREEQQTYFSLANAHKGGQFLPALAIFETNSLPCDDALASNPSNGRRGIFLIAAQVNHSCAPNVSRVWDPAAQVMVFRALRQIAPGEELCVNYIDLLATRDERRGVLQQHFGFTCICSVCTSEGECLAESDRRRATLRRLYDEAATCLNEPTLGMRKIKIALRLLKEEDLVHYEASFSFDAFQFCVMVSDFANAKQWVRKAWEASCVTSGPSSPAARTFKMYWANPRTHRFSGKLPRMVLSSPD